MPIVFRVASVAGAVERRVCCHYTVREQPLEAEITDSTCCLFWHVTCDKRETPDSHLNTADRKSCRGTERRSHSFLLNYIMYINDDLGQI